MPIETQPTRASADSRIALVDVLRGFALVGLFLVHMLESYELYWIKADAGPISKTVFALLMGKSFSLLALCFGFSFYILMDRAAKRGEDFRWRFAWRLTVLFAIGWCHALIYRGDIVQLLALTGFLLLALDGVKDNRILIALAAFCFLGPVKIVQLASAMAGGDWVSWPPMHWDDPSMPIYVSGTLPQVLGANAWAGQWPKWWFMFESGRLLQILGLYLVGMVLGRIGFFARPRDFAKGRWIALGIALPLAIALWWVRDPLVEAFQAEGYGPAANYLFASLIGSWADLTATAAWALLVTLAVLSPVGPALRPLAPLGRLTLTLYIGQSLVFVPIFYGFGLGVWDDWSEATRLWVGIAAAAVQIVFAMWWIRTHHYGPLEWLWRAATYRTWNVPFRRKAAAAT